MKNLEKIYIVKQAATLVGGGYGLSKAPEGEKAEGLLHGLLRGLGVDFGAAAGLRLGGGVGEMIRHKGRMENPDWKKSKLDFSTLLKEVQNKQGNPQEIWKPGQSALSKRLRGGAPGVLAALGILGGGIGGHQIMDKFMGKAPYDE